ncbi:MAG: putative repeat protein (TIGR01451 family) [Psychrobacter glaciei]|jgi:uncharacterized repeat protein (TIGR01451 family)|uniref:hypothetical protein n=1 Tax=Psychrobacter glaciei TaxID=619771 RepID=UPI0039E6919A
MKSNTFNYSLLAVGVAAVMGISTSAMAVDSSSTTTSVEIKNVATASYSVGTVSQPPVTSNEVKVTVSEQVSFSLVADNTKTVAPNGFVGFQHTLTNTGNRSDIYTVSLQNLTDDDTQYDLTKTTIAYKIYNSGVTPNATGSNNAGTGTIPANNAAGGTITLAKGQFAIIDINAKTNANKGGNQQNLQITAVSAVIPATTTNAAVPGKTLTNKDISTTTLPTFSLVKTITNALDLNDINDIATYQIIVKNPATAYSAEATNILIEDILPAGLIVATPASTFVASNGSEVGTIARTTNGFTLTDAKLAVDGTITIVLNVKRDPSVAPAVGALNHVKVTDDLDDNAATTDNILIDSTDSTVENVVNFYPADDTDQVGGTPPVNAEIIKGTDYTQPLVTIKRNLKLTQVTDREIAPTTGTTSTAIAGQVTHQTIITNDGQDTEGDTANELTFTITDNDGATPDTINVVPGTVKISYTPPNSTTAGTAIVISPNGSGVYDIFTALPAGIAAGGKVTISYNVSSNQAPLFTPANSATSTEEDTVVTLIPVGEGKPTVNPTITDTTTVKGLTLEKFQAIDTTCTGTFAAAVFSKDPITEAKPDQCIIYRINAKNTSSDKQTTDITAVSGFDITALEIKDLFSNFAAGADFINSTTTNSVPTSSVSTINSTIADPVIVLGTSVAATASTLAPQNVATLSFKVKIKNAR